MTSTNEEIEKCTAYQKSCVLLRQLGITGTSKGFYQTAYGAALCFKEPYRLADMPEMVYSEIGVLFEISWTSARNRIAAQGRKIWERNQALLKELSPIPLYRAPSPGQLLAILAFASEKAVECKAPPYIFPLTISKKEV